MIGLLEFILFLIIVLSLFGVGSYFCIDRKISRGHRYWKRKS